MCFSIQTNIYLSSHNNNNIAKRELLCMKYTVFPFFILTSFIHTHEKNILLQTNSKFSTRCLDRKSSKANPKQMENESRAHKNLLLKHYFWFEMEVAEMMVRMVLVHTVYYMLTNASYRYGYY